MGEVLNGDDKYNVLLVLEMEGRNIEMIDKIERDQFLHFESLY